MGYFIRFIYTDLPELNFTKLAAALQAVDPAYHILPDLASADSGDLLVDGDVYGEIAINPRGDDLFEEDMEEFMEVIEAHDDPNRALVAERLANAAGMVVLRPTQRGFDDAARLDILWDWLFDHDPAGLLQVDDEGFFDRHHRLLTMI